MQKKVGSENKNYGIIVTAILTFLDFVSAQIQNSIILSFFHNYRGFEKKCQDSFLAGKVSAVSKIKYSFLKFKLKFASYARDSILLDAFEKMGKAFFNTSLKSFGIFLLTYGLFLVSVNLGTRMDNILNLKISNTFLFGCILIIVSLFMIPVRKSNISAALKGSRILSYFLFDVFSVKHINTNNEKKEVLATSGMSIIFGLFVGAVSYLISPLFVAFVAGLIFVLYLVLTKPENGILLICLAFPFMSDKILSFLIVATAFSTLFKILRGKRALHFNICSFASVLLAIIVWTACIGSFDSAGAFADASDIIFAVVLVLTVITVITSSSLIDKCFRMLGVSTVLTSLYGIILFLIACISNRNFSEVLTGFYRIGMMSCFSHSDFFATFLICLIPAIFIKHERSSRLTALASFIIAMVCLVMSNSYYAVLSVIIALIFSVIVFSRFGLWVAVVAAAFIQIIKMLLPSVAPLSVAKYLEMVNNTENGIFFKYNTGLSEYVSGFWFCGSGAGTDSAAFASASTGNTIAYYSGFGETYINMIMKIGIPLFILAILIIFVFVSRILTYSLDSSKSPTTRTVTASVICSLVAVTVFGFFTNLLIDFRIVVMIFLIMSLGSAACDSADNDYIIPGTVREIMYPDIEPEKLSDTVLSDK